MADKVGSIYYDVDLDNKEFKRKASETSGAVSRIKNGFESARLGSFALLGGMTALGLGMAKFASNSIKVAANIETMTQGFVTLLGSSEKANEAINMIKKDAASTPFELPGLIQANQLLTAVTKDAPRSEKLLLNVGKALSAMGKGQEELDRIIVNLQQIGAVGKATMLDVKQFAFAGIPIFEMLSEATGKTGEALEEMISSGGVTFDMLEEMFNKAGTGSGRFAQAFETQAGTFNQLVSNMKDNIAIFGSELVKQTGLFDLAKRAVNKFNEVMGILQTKISDAGGIMPFLRKVFDDNRTIIIAVAGALVGALIPALVATGTAIWGAFAPLIPFIAIGAGLAILIDKLVQRFGGWHTVLSKIRNIFGNVKDFGKTFIDAWKSDDLDLISKSLEPIGGILEKLGLDNETVTNAISMIKTKLQELSTQATETKDALILFFTGDYKKGMSFEEDSDKVSRIIEMRESFIQTFNEIKLKLGDILQSLAPLFESIGQQLSDLWNTIKTELFPALKELWEFIKPVLIPILKVIGVVIGVLIVGAVVLVIGIIKGLIAILTAVVKVVSWAINNFIDSFRFFVTRVKEDFAKFKNTINAVVETIKSIPGKIKTGLSNLKEAITKPFREAFDWIKEEVGKVTGILDKLNPFHRESPSLVDKITRGTNEISNLYSGLFDSLGQAPSVSLLAQPQSGSIAQGSVANVELKIDNYYGDQVGLTNLTEKIMKEMDRIKQTR